MDGKEKLKKDKAVEILRDSRCAEDDDEPCDVSWAIDYLSETVDALDAQVEDLSAQLESLEDTYEQYQIESEENSEL